MILSAPITWRSVSGADDVHPFIDIVLQTPALSRRGQSFSTPVLIDTGASLSMFLPDVLTLIGAPIVGSTRLHGNWADTDSRTYEVSLSLKSAPQFVLDAKVAELTHQSGTPVIAGVLGMDFLKLTTATLDGPGRKGSLVLDIEQLRTMARG